MTGCVRPAAVSWQCTAAPKRSGSFPKSSTFQYACQTAAAQGFIPEKANKALRHELHTAGIMDNRHVPCIILLCLATIAQLQAIVNAQYASTCTVICRFGAWHIGSLCLLKSTVAQQGCRASQGCQPACSCLCGPFACSPGILFLSFMLLSAFSEHWVW